MTPDEIQRARSLRSNMTDAERMLWRHLRERQVSGHRFRRQQPIGRYIVDFACMESRLVVEVDGGQHGERVADDDDRTKFLNDRGYAVLRFWNNDVLKNIEGVVQRIREHLDGQTLPPPCEGED